MDKIKKYYFTAFTLLPLFQIVAQIVLHKNIVNLFGLAGVAIYLSYLLIGEKLNYPKYLFPFILLIAYYVIWDFVNGSIAEKGIVLYFYRNSWIYSLVILILIENTNFNDQFIDRIILIFKGTIVISFVVIVFQFIANPYFLMPEEAKLQTIYLQTSQYEIRLQSIFGYIAPNEVGFSLIPIVSILIGYYLAKNKSFSLIWIFMAGFIFFGTKTRFIYLNFFIILLQYPLVYGVKLKRVFRILIIGFVSSLIILFVLQSIGFSFVDFIENRLLSESSSTRLLAVKMFTEFFPNNPFFGTGIHVDENLLRAIGGRSSQMHVGYLSHLYEYGIAGSILLFYFLYLVYRKFKRDSRFTLYYGSLFAIVTVLVANLTLVHFSIYNYGLLFAFIFNKYFNDQYISEDIS